MISQPSIFTNESVPSVLWGVSLYTGSTRLAEMAGKIGFDVVWIEMEHGPTDYQNAENICLAAQAGGAIPAIRLPSGQRHHVLRALEIGARIVVIPMVDTAEEAAGGFAKGATRRTANGNFCPARTNVGCRHGSWLRHGHLRRRRREFGDLMD